MVMAQSRASNPGSGLGPGAPDRPPGRARGHRLGADPVQAGAPARRPSEGLRSVGVQDVDARLWQDPFAAVIGGPQGPQGGQGPESPSAGRWRSVPTVAPCWCAAPAPGTALTPRERRARPATTTWTTCRDKSCARAEALGKERAGVPDNPPVTVLGIMVSAGPSPGAAETRRRYRYAALSALMLEGFLPDDAEHVGLCRPRQGRATGVRPLRMVYPQHRRPPPSGPVAALAGRRQPGGPGAAHRSPWAGHDPRGPAPSGSPVAPPDQARQDRGRRDRSASSSWARRGPGPWRPWPRSTGTTSPPCRRRHRPRPLGPGSPASGPPSPPSRAPSPTPARPHAPSAPAAPRSRPAWPCARPPPAERTIASDDALAELLVAELGRRRVAGNAGIALVGQWDTAYSRTLAELVEKRLARAAGQSTAAGRRGHLGQTLQLHARHRRPDPRGQAPGQGGG